MEGKETGQKWVSWKGRNIERRRENERVGECSQNKKVVFLKYRKSKKEKRQKKYMQKGEIHIFTA